MQNRNTLQNMLVNVLEDYIPIHGINKFGEDVAAHLDQAVALLQDDGEECTPDAIAQHAIDSLLDNAHDGEAMDIFPELEARCLPEDFEEWYCCLQVCKWIEYMASASL